MIWSTEGQDYRDRDADDRSNNNLDLVLLMFLVIELRFELR